MEAWKELKDSDFNILHFSLSSSGIFWFFFNLSIPINSTLEFKILNFIYKE